MWAWLAATRAVLAAPPADAAAEPHVWYRSGPGCPDGDQFVERLERLGRSVALARVGDPVDFVVTLASAAGRSSGRLERQSERGTVAIRELSAESCVEVAEGLALSLELAAEPPVADAADRALHELAPSDRAPSELASNENARHGVALGAQLGAEGQAGGVLPGAALFAQLSFADRASARLSVRGAHGAAERDVLVSFGLLRGEVCLRAWGGGASSGALAVHPCVGADVGVLQGDSRAESAQRQRAAWAGAVGHVRAVLQLGTGFALEAQAGALVPFTRYEFSTESGRPLTRTPAVGAQAALGASMSW